jgi:transcriptional regulator with XRE-family HTH domain
MNKLSELRKKKNYTQAQLSKLLGIASNTLSQYEHDKRGIPDNIKMKIADIFGVTVDYILGRAAQERPDDIYEDGEIKKYSLLPVYDRISGDYRGEAERALFCCADVEYNESDHFILRALDNGMAPTIPEGSLVVVRAQNRAKKGDIAVFCFNCGYAQLKRYFPQSDGCAVLRGDKPDSENYTVTARQFRTNEAQIIGVVCETRIKFDKNK